MRSLSALALVLLAGIAAAAEVKGWTVLKGVVPQTDARPTSPDALNTTRLTFNLTKRGRRLNGAGEPKLSVLCRPGNLGIVVTGANPVNGPGGRVRAEVRFDEANPKVTQWALTGNLYGYLPATEPEIKSFVAQFLVSKQLAISFPLRPNVVSLDSRDVQMLAFDLNGFAEAATEMRRTCPF